MDVYISTDATVDVEIDIPRQDDHVPTRFSDINTTCSVYDTRTNAPSHDRIRKLSSRIVVPFDASRGGKTVSIKLHYAVTVFGHLPRPLKRCTLRTRCVVIITQSKTAFSVYILTYPMGGPSPAFEFTATPPRKYYK